MNRLHATGHPTWETLQQRLLQSGDAAPEHATHGLALIDVNLPDADQIAAAWAGQVIMYDSRRAKAKNLLDKAVDARRSSEGG